MNDQFNNLFQGIKGANSGTRIVAASCGAAVLLILGLVALVSSQTSYEVLLTGLDDGSSAKSMKALTEAGIDFEVSQPPAPFVLYVDSGERSKALHSIATAGALDRPMKGIAAADNGVSSVFMSAAERQQMVQKREWQEMEGMLEEFAFVSAARLRTSTEKRSPLFTGKRQPTTASVNLQLRTAAELTDAQANSVTTLVSRGLGIDPEHIVISDQYGRSIHDGHALADEGSGFGGWFDHKERYDGHSTARANAILESVLGAGRAHVTVDSSWNFDQSTIVSESASKGPIISEVRDSTESPFESRQAVGGIAGTASNVAIGPVLPNATAPASTGIGSEPLLSTTEETQRTYRPNVVTTQTVRTVPVLERLSVSLFLDSSVDSVQAADIEDAIKAAVGFDLARNDSFSAVRLPFAAITTATGNPAFGGAGGEAVPAEPSMFKRIFVDRGIEILAVLAFLFLLARSLKPAKKALQASNPVLSNPDPDQLGDLARAQVDEIVREDPARVARILTGWARGERTATGSPL